MPIGIKDIIDVKGLPTACGAKRWADEVAESDAPVVARLREAGAVIMGKTVTTPYAWIDPPPTRNPWNLDRTPGGSSSGSAAAVACGMCFGAIGTPDRRLDHAAGVVLRGRRDEAQLPPESPTSTGSAMPLRAEPGPRRSHRAHGRRPAVAPRAMQGHRSHPSGVAEADLAPGRPPPRLVRFRGFFDRRAEPAVRSAFDAALSALRGAWGARSSKWTIPSISSRSSRTTDA